MTPAEIPQPPSGWRRLAWLGPGFLWMVSAAGSGELLFTPRVGSLYGYALLWALLLAVALKWAINREIGRYAVCTGRNLLAGVARLPGPRHWAVWLIVVPQLVVAVATLAGLAGAAATALVLVLPGDIRWWTIGAIISSTSLVVFGRYRGVEWAATVLAIALALAAMTAAIAIGPDWAALGSGLAPSWPAGTDAAEVLPWLGFILSGAAGMIWYSFWLPAKGYGAAKRSEVDTGTESPTDLRRLRGWIRQMSADNTVAVIGTLLITVAFLILGTEVLRPLGLRPEEDQVADVLGRLLGQIWGPVGFWFMVTAVFVAFWDTILSDQDGFGRMFTTAWAQLGKDRGQSRDRDRRRHLMLVIVLLAVIPAGVYLLVGEPVGLLKLAGIIEAGHLPFIAVCALVLNRRELPGPLKPTLPAIVATGIAASFFAAFAVFYLATL